MTPSDDLISLYDQLVTISQRALQNSHYEVSFHALEGAFHCAKDLGDLHRLCAIQDEAAEQRSLIDTEAATHRMSTQEANKRGGQNLYTLLIRQIDSVINQIEHDKRQQALGVPKPWVKL